MVSLFDFAMLGVILFVFVSPILYAFLTGGSNSPVAHEADLAERREEGRDDS